MMNKDLIDRIPRTMLEDALRKIGLPWVWFTVIMAVLVMVLETPHEMRFGTEKFIRSAVFDLVIVAYTLTAWSMTRHFLARCLTALEPLIIGHLPDSVGYSKKEWLFAVGLGLGLTFVANMSNKELGLLTTWMNIVSAFLAYSTFGWVMYGLLASASQITHFILRTTTVNIFDVSPFRPVAHWCLSAAVLIMGAITIANLFLAEKMFSTPILVTYTIASAFGIFVFFAGMWSTHQRMYSNKANELARINEELQGLHKDILANIQERNFEKSRLLLDASASLSLHRDRVDKLPDWPYTIGSLGGLASSIAIPVVINLLSKLV